MLVGICGLDTVGLDTGGFGYLWCSLLTVNGLSSRLILLRGGESPSKHPGLVSFFVCHQGAKISSKKWL